MGKGSADANAERQTGHVPGVIAPAGSKPLTGSARKAAETLRVVIDGVGIRSGGGATVLESFLTCLPRVRPAWEIEAFLLPESCRTFRVQDESGGVKVSVSSCGNSGLGRVLWQNVILPRRLGHLDAQVLFSLCNAGAVWPRLPQVVYLHQLNSFLGVGPGLVGARSRLRFWIIGMLAFLTGRRSHTVIVQTESMREGVVKRFPALADRLLVIPSGIRGIRPLPDSQARVRQLLGDGPGPVVSYISSLSAHKNHAALLAAWPIVRARFPYARLALTLGLDAHGAGVSVRGSTWPGAALLRELPVGVVDLGVLTQDEVWSLYARSDLMVFPSLAESFGLPLVEAMAGGCAVAAANLPYAHEILGNAGAYFDPRSPESIAAVVSDLLAADAMREQLVRIGQQRCKEYRAEAVAERVAQVLEAAAMSGQVHRRTARRKAKANGCDEKFG